MTKVYNKREYRLKRRKLRKNMPPAEVILWSQLRNKQLKGYKFRRQYSVDRFIVDFYCPQAKIAIEIDGESHGSREAEVYDYRRSIMIESFGIRVLRFTNWDVYENLDGVISAIVCCLA